MLLQSDNPKKGQPQPWRLASEVSVTSGSLTTVSFVAVSMLSIHHCNSALAEIGRTIKLAFVSPYSNFLVILKMTIALCAVLDGRETGHNRPKKT